MLPELPACTRQLCGKLYRESHWIRRPTARTRPTSASSSKNGVLCAVQCGNSTPKSMAIRLAPVSLSHANTSAQILASAQPASLPSVLVRGRFRPTLNRGHASTVFLAPTWSRCTVSATECAAEVSNGSTGLMSFRSANPGLQSEALRVPLHVPAIRGLFACSPGFAPNPRHKLSQRQSDSAAEIRQADAQSCARLCVQCRDLFQDGVVCEDMSWVSVNVKNTSRLTIHQRDRQTRHLTSFLVEFQQAPLFPPSSPVGPENIEKSTRPPLPKQI